ncbi:MAG TPA: hypothetical protein VHT71_26250 [Methylomirabilota bacterium]|jgi:hypothetical protein|nr:hypothetical protein [Methylomirabilota bacterium]
MSSHVMTALHRLFAAPAPSPALQQFVDALGSTPYAWHVSADGRLRAAEGDEELCAITGVVRHRTGAFYSVGDWVRAAERIGLSYGEAGLIVEAADRPRSSNAVVAELRARMLAVIRTRPAGPARRPDAMDQALADLLAGRTGAASTAWRSPRESAPAPAAALARSAR